MEPTFKIVLDKRRRKKDFTYPLKLRVYQGRLCKEKSLGISIPEADWDAPLQQVSTSNISYKLYNTKILSIKIKVQKSILYDEEDQVLSPNDIVEKVSHKKSSKKLAAKPDIIEYGKNHIERLKETGNIGNAIAYSCSISKLKAYAKSEKLAFDDLTYSFLDGFYTAMLSEGMKINSISLYLRSIRALFNKAIKQKLIDANQYPFSVFRIKSVYTGAW